MLVFSHTCIQHYKPPEAAMRLRNMRITSIHGWLISGRNHI